MPWGTRSTARHPSGAVAVALSALLVTLVAAAPGQAARKGRGTVGGTVTSMAGEPLAGITVTLEAADGSVASATTSKRGRFSIEVAAGEYVVSFAAEGYAPFASPLTVEAGARPVISVQLLEAAAGRRSAAAQEFNAGVEAYEAGDRAAARARLLAAVEADPTLLEPYRLLADLHLDEGAWADAARAAETHLAAKPGDRQVQLIAYEAYRKLDDPGRVAELRRALAADPELKPKLAVHAFNEGALADQQGDAESAAERFAEAIELDGSLAAAHFGKATLELRAERYEEARETLGAGLAVEPESAQGRRLAFLIEDGLGDSGAAARALDAYAEVDPAGAAEILFRRGEADFRDGALEPARERLSRAAELRPGHAATHHLLGLAWLTADAGLARKHLERFLELDPALAEAEGVPEILSTLE